MRNDKADEYEHCHHYGTHKMPKFDVEPAQSTEACWPAAIYDTQSAHTEIETLLVKSGRRLRQRV